MYNDVKKKTNFQIATEKDIEEIRNVMDYVSGLILKNEKEANNNETINSMRKATKYISAKKNLNDSNTLDNQIIINSYIESNRYYQDLYENYNIDYVTSREAKNFRILKVTKPTLNRNDEILFNECYNETMEYYLKVISTKAFNNQQYNYEYFKMLIISIAIQKYLTKKLGYFFNIDLYDEKMLKNSFISYGFDYFDILPINYKRRLLKLLNELVISKGTNSDIEKILNIFGFKNIDVYKYILSKAYPMDKNGKPNYQKPYLVFYKTKATDVIDYEKDLVLNYDSVVENDPFWRADYNDLINNKEFNSITSKYMSVDLSLDIVEETMKMSYFMTFLYKMENEFKEKQDIDFGFYNREISSSFIHIFDAVVALNSLVLKQHKLPDKINHKENKKFNIYGYDNINDNEDIKELLEEIQILLIQNKHELNFKRQYEELYKYFGSFNLKTFKDPLDYTDMNEVISLYENYALVKNQLNNGLARYSDNYAFKEFMKDETKEILDKFEFLRKYLIMGKYACKDVLVFPELLTILNKYIIIQGNKLPTTRIEINNIFLNNENLIKEMEDIVNSINTANIQESFHTGDYFKVLDYVIISMEETRQVLREKYPNADRKSLEIIFKQSPYDLTHYEELYAFYKIFYEPFKNLQDSRKYSMDNFIQIFLNNEELRTKLQEFIIETDNYQLYKRYNKLFNTKMITKNNTDIYNGFDYFSEYVKNKNIGLYEWMIPDKSIEEDKVKRKEFYQDRIFELCESIDNYISLDLFMNHTFTGVIDIVRKVLYLIITVFKSYTIDLLDSNTVLTINDKSFNAIRLFDEIDSINVSDEFSEMFRLRDVHRSFVYEQFIESLSGRLITRDMDFRDSSISLKEKIKIKEIN